MRRACSPSDTSAPADTSGDTAQPNLDIDVTDAAAGTVNGLVRLKFINKSSSTGLHTMAYLKDAG